MLKQKHEQIKAYVIHTRPFRETSLLIEFFTEKLGRCSAISRGAYSGKSPKKLLLQPFNPLSISLQGSTDLLSLTQVERTSLSASLAGEALVCGLYLNELLYHLVHRYDPHPALFDAYCDALNALPHKPAANTLREFEFILLEELGYGIHFEMIKNAEAHYRYIPQQGFIITEKNNSPDVFSAEILNAIAEKNWAFPGALGVAKHLTRIALAPLLAGREIHSRQLL